jgi:hypothetical protein
MKQISTGTGLVVLSGTILASVFLSSPRTATTAFASAQQAQSAERGVGRKVVPSAPVSISASCSYPKEIWFNTQQPRELQFDDCNWPPLESNYAADLNRDGKIEFMNWNFPSTEFCSGGVFCIVQDSQAVAYSDCLIVGRVIISVSNPSIQNFNTLDLPASFGEYFLTKLAIASAYFQPFGFLDCDGDNDLDLFFVVSSVLIDGSITQTWGWLENTGFQHPASLEGDLNGDGDVDSADLGRLLGGFTG